MVKLYAMNKLLKNYEKQKKRRILCIYAKLCRYSRLFCKTRPITLKDIAHDLKAW